MSIIQDALKKAQEERAKKNKREIPYHLTGVQKKLRIVVYAVIAVACAVAVIAYLYIPYFHKPKTAMKAVPAQASAVTKSQGATIAVQSLPETQKPVNPIQQKENKGYTDQASRSVNEKSEVPMAVQDKKELIAVRTGMVRTQTSNPVFSTRRKPASSESKGGQDIVAEPQKTIENVEKRRNNESADVIYNEALKEQQSGRIKEARAIYKRVLGIQPNHVETLNNLGVLAIREGNTQEALFYFKRILEYQKSYSKAYNNIGLIAMKDGNHQLAEEYLRKAVSLEPSDGEPYLNLSALLRSQGKFQEAEKVLEMPIQKKIKDPNLFLSYAVIKDNLGQYEDAARYYRQYLSSARNQPLRKDVVERLSFIETKTITK